MQFEQHFIQACKELNVVVEWLIGDALVPIFFMICFFQRVYGEGNNIIS
jgi:hypothetical protein